MDARFQALPPLKRLKLRQLEQCHKQQTHEPELKTSQLPAKKRKESRFNYSGDEKAAPTYCLPAKKRVWAIDPALLSGKPLSPFDLNVEYKASFEEEEPMVENFENKSSDGTKGLDLEEEDKENIDPLVKENNQSIRKLDEDEPDESKELYESKRDAEQEREVVGEEKESKELDESKGDDEQEEVVGEEDDGIVCSVCQSTDGDPSDPIVFCDGCELMVHTTCYGNPLINGIPDGDWFCNQCLSSKSMQRQSEESTFSCCLCPLKNGAMKRTKDGRWAHLVCALFVPEVFFEDPEGREGINCDGIPKKRFKERCYVCRSRSGCAIECSEQRCPLWFHITCGLKEDLCIEYREGKKKGAIVAGFCKDHTRLWEKQQQTGKFKIVARDEQ